MTNKEKIAIYNEFLVRLHTARWTGNAKEVGRLLDRAGAYSYARTNSRFGDTAADEKRLYEGTLKGLIA